MMAGLHYCWFVMMIVCIDGRFAMMAGLQAWLACNDVWSAMMVDLQRGLADPVLPMPSIDNSKHSGFPIALIL